jgi:hypothetical protein
VTRSPRLDDGIGHLEAAVAGADDHDTLNGTRPSRSRTR